MNTLAISAAAPMVLFLSFFLIHSILLRRRNRRNGTK